MNWRNKVISLALAGVMMVTAAAAVLASDITNALYFSNIDITNNSTVRSDNITVTVTINTTNLIATDYLNQGANNTVLRGPGGADVPFMPGPGDSIPWAIWLDGIGPNAVQTDILFTANSTDGEIRYFPAASGMATSDNESLELSDNFSYYVSGYIDTTAGVAKRLIYKPEAFAVIVSEVVSGNISAQILGTANVSSLNTVSSTAQIFTPNSAGQKFVSGNAMMVTAVNLSLTEFGTGSVGTLFVSIVGVNSTGGIDTSDNVTQGSAPASIVQGASSWYTINVTPANLAANTSYGVYAWTDTGDAVDGVLFDQDAAGGTFPWWGFTSADRVNFLQFGPGANRFEMEILGENVTRQLTATGVLSGEHSIRVTDRALLDFDRANSDRLDAGKPAALNLFGGMTISAWIYPVQVDTGAIYADANGVPNEAQVMFRLNGPRLLWQQEGTAFLSVSGSSEDVLVNRWSHVAGTRASSTGTITLYLDGVADATTGTSTSASVGVFGTAGNKTIGRLGDFDAHYFDGMMASVRIYDRGLTGVEILNDFNVGRDGSGYTTTNLTADWYMREGEGNFAIDIRSGINASRSFPIWIDEFDLFIDDVLVEHSLNATQKVPNNSANYSYLTNNVMPYMESTAIWIGWDTEDTSEQWIMYENNPTWFNDLSGTGHTAIPTFRTTGDTSNVTAEMTSFKPVAEAKAPPFTLANAPDYINPAITGNITANFTTTAANGTFPLAGVIRAIAGTTTPAQLPLLLIVLFVVLALSLATGFFMRKFGRGSLFVKWILIVSVLGIALAIGNFGLDLWMIIVISVWAIAMMFMSRHGSFS